MLKTRTVGAKATPAGIEVTFESSEPGGVYRLLQQSAATTPTTYANIRDNEHPASTAFLTAEAVELNG